MNASSVTLDRSRDLEAIETKLESLLVHSEEHWTQVAQLVKTVEQRELWRSSHRSFTSWVKALSKKVGLSPASVWRVYRAGSVLEGIHQKLSPNTQLSLNEIQEIYPAATVTGLNSLGKLARSRIDPEFLGQLEQEYINGAITGSNLAAIGNEIERCKRLSIDNILPVIALRKMDIPEILGLKNERFRLITDLPLGSMLDGLGIIKSDDDTISFVGIVLNRTSQGDIKDAVDWLITVRTNPAFVPEYIESLVDLNQITGEFHVVGSPKKLLPDEMRKAKLALKILPKVVFTSRTPLQVDDTPQEDQLH
jgi:hypothetical protein